MSIDVASAPLRKWTVGRQNMTDDVECEIEEYGDGFKAFLTPLTLTDEQVSHWKQRIRLHHPTVEQVHIADTDDFYHEIVLSNTSLMSAREVVCELACELDLLAYTLQRNEPRGPTNK